MSTKVSVIVAAGLLAVAFVVGVLVGRVAQEKPRLTASTSAKTGQVPELERELAACRQELAAHSMSRVSSSAAASVPDEPKGAASETEAKVEVLERELQQCKKRGMFFNVDLCLAPDRYAISLLLPMLHADRKCVDRFGVGDLIVKHSEQCAKFDDQDEPDDLGLGKLSDNEERNLYRAQHFGRARDFSANIARGMKRMIRDCHKKFGLSDE